MRRFLSGVVVLFLLGTAASARPEAGVAWPGDDGPIAFSHDGVVYTANPDGSDLQEIAEGVNPAWSPDGTTLVYTCDGQICTVTPGSGEEGSPITLDPTLRSKQPSWSPAGDQIVFVRDDVVNTSRNKGTLYVIDADGSDERSLEVRGENPAWSPDGEQIIFTRGLQGDGIYSTTPNGGSFEKVFDNDVYIHAPTWSPDGRYIAFLLQFRNFWRIWKIYPGHEVYEIFRGEGRAPRDGRPTIKEVSGRGLAWSPSGKRILYGNLLKGKLCRITVEGRRRGCVVPGEYPDWAPAS